jgi:nicotinamidase-related amidase
MTALDPLGPGAVHVAVDMQRLFAEPTRWQVPDLPAIVPQIATLARARPGRTLFTRFTLPERAADAPGRWRGYYEHWSEFTSAAMPADMIGLIAELTPYADARTTIDKATYSAFETSAFGGRLEALAADTLIFTGVETDVCVLGTLLTAVDRGYRVIAVKDALASSSRDAHEATLRHVLPRLDRQVEIADCAAVLTAWS